MLAAVLDERSRSVKKIRGKLTYRQNGVRVEEGLGADLMGKSGFGYIDVPGGLRFGLLNEIQIHLVSVLLGEGIRLSDFSGTNRIEL